MTLSENIRKMKSLQMTLNCQHTEIEQSTSASERLILEGGFKNSLAELKKVQEAFRKSYYMATNFLEPYEYACADGLVEKNI